MIRSLARLLAGGRTLGELAGRLGMRRSELGRLEIAYRSFVLPKRGGGQREILAPRDRLKTAQRLVLRRVLDRVPVHAAAFGFERGRSIVDNARVHAGRAVVVCMDLVDFFPSIDAARVEALLRRLGWGRGAAARLTELCTHEGAVPQGAPTSPRIANILARRLDRRLESIAVARGARYTRYADDLSFSFEEDERAAIHSLIATVEKVVTSEGFRLHRREKLTIRRRHQRQMVTGLVVNERPRLPRETRRWLRAVKHRVERGERSTLDPEQLAGWLAYERMIAR